MRILHLTLKRKFYDMIDLGDKREEYRELKEYWQNRLWIRDSDLGFDGGFFKDFDVVKFKNGYSKHARTMLWEFKGTSIGEGKPQWGAPPQDVFIINLGERITTLD